MLNFRPPFFDLLFFLSRTKLQQNWVFICFCHWMELSTERRRWRPLLCPSVYHWDRRHWLNRADKSPFLSVFNVLISVSPWILRPCALFTDTSFTPFCCWLARQSAMKSSVSMCMYADSLAQVAGYDDDSQQNRQPDRQMCTCHFN